VVKIRRDRELGGRIGELEPRIGKLVRESVHTNTFLGKGNCLTWLFQSSFRATFWPIPPCINVSRWVIQKDQHTARLDVLLVCAV